MTPEQQAIINRIRSSAIAIQRAVEAMPEDQRTQPARENDWSVQEILTHTLNGDLFAFDLRIRRMLIEDDPLYSDYNEVAFREAIGLSLLPVDDLVRLIVAEHELLANLLSSLPESAWQRRGHHAEYGPRTIEYFARRVAEHSEEHAKQISDFKFQIAD